MIGDVAEDGEAGSGFFRRYWEKEPYHLARDNASHYEDLMGAADIVSLGLMSHAQASFRVRVRVRARVSFGLYPSAWD